MAEDTVSASPSGIAVEGIMTGAELVHKGAPAVIINPDAASETMLSWARTQLRLLDSLLLPISCASCDIQIEPSELAVWTRELLLQSMAVLEAVQQRLATRRPTSAPGA